MSNRASQQTKMYLLLNADGDLDPHLSRYTLTPLKIAYKKLRVLVDRGCIFIGHGLSKDFRIISMYRVSEWSGVLVSHSRLCRHLRSARTGHRHCRPLFHQKSTAPTVTSLPLLVRAPREHPNRHTRLHRGRAFGLAAVQGIYPI